MHGDDGASVVVDDPSIQRSVMQYEGGCGDIDSLHPLRTIFRAIRRGARLLLAQFATQRLQQRERTIECLLDRNVTTCGNLCDVFGEFRLESVQTLQ